MLKLRSGRRSGFPVENGLSKFSKKLGSLKPEPTDPRILVPGAAKASAAARYVQKLPNRSFSSRRPPAVSWSRGSGRTVAWAYRPQLSRPSRKDPAASWR